MTRLFCVLLSFIVLPWAFAQSKNSVQPCFESLAKFNHVRDLALSYNEKEAYTTIQSPLGELSVIVKIQKEEKEWGSPELTSFSGQYNDLEPFLSPDNLRLYFVSDRPLKSTTTEAKDYDIWYVERENLNAPWGVPVNLGAPVNTAKNEFYPSVAANGNLYFTSDWATSKGKDDIFFSRWNGKSYDNPVSLDSNVNSNGYEFNAYIAPTESFLIFTGYNRTDGLGSGDLYLAINKAGNWTKADSLGSEINSSSMDYCPFFHFKTKMLYFTSKRSAINKSTPYENMEAVNKALTGYAVGYSRLYKVKLSGLNIPEKH